MAQTPGTSSASSDSSGGGASFTLGEGLSEADLDRRRRLRRMRGVATGLLILAAIIYFLTLDQDGWLGFVNAGSEAAMVGAIADWFAVTALFRHPLGLPIPHTAIIPRKKASLGASLQEFVTDNFLREDVIRGRVESASVARRAGVWLATPEHADRVVGEGSKVASDFLNRIHHDDVSAILNEVVIPRVVAEPLSPALGQLLAEVVEEGAHIGLIDLGLDELYRWLERHPERFTAVLKERAPSWSPDWATNLVVDRLLREAQDWIVDVREDPGARARVALDYWLRELAVDLQHDPETMERAERLKERLVTQPKAIATAVRLWDSLRLAVIDALADAQGHLRRRITDELLDLGDRLQNDGQFASRVDGWVADAAAYAVNNYGAEVAQVISSTVEAWDGEETAKRIELHVGRDLQFIRINGTVVGGLAGLVIHAFAVLV